MTRLPDWPARLDAFLAANAGRDFQYGDWDCFQFARGALVAMTGEDIGREFRPYRSRFGYLRQMARRFETYDVAQFMDTLLKRHGWMESERPGRGQLAAVKTEIGPALGVVSLCRRFVWALAASGRMIALPVSAVEISWKERACLR